MFPQAITLLTMLSKIKTIVESDEFKEHVNLSPIPSITEKSQHFIENLLQNHEKYEINIDVFDATNEIVNNLFTRIEAIYQDQIAVSKKSVPFETNDTIFSATLLFSSNE